MSKAWLHRKHRLSRGGRGSLGVDPAKRYARDFRQAFSLSSPRGSADAKPAHTGPLFRSIAHVRYVQQQTEGLDIRNSLARTHSLTRAKSPLITTSGLLGWSAEIINTVPIPSQFGVFARRVPSLARTDGGLPALPPTGARVLIREWTTSYEG